MVVVIGVSCAAALPPSAAGDIHDYRGAVPVLVYHGIEPAPRPGDPYTLSRAEFARQMAMLDREGFNSISIGQYARFAAGDATGLPNRPLLITFDDSRADSYGGADAILARHGLRATMFVITANASAARPGYLSWPQLRVMAASGRWDVQLHAHAGHVLIPTGAGGRRGPYYANLLYRNGSRERFSAFKRRITTDILTGRRLLMTEVPGFEPVTFAVPFSDYGQEHTNYAPIPRWVRGWLTGTFKAFFVQDRRVYNLPGNPVGQRYGVRRETTTEALHEWLRRALPQSAWVFPVKRPQVRRKRIRRRTVTILFKVRDGITLRATHRRAGRRHRERVPVSGSGRLRDRRLRPNTVYIYRVVAVDADGRRSKVLRLRVRTRR